MTERLPLEVTFPKQKVLLHSCCAPCAGELMEAMLASGLDMTIFFYNPNIHPKKEYEIRKNENIRFAEKMNIPFVDADYDVQDWFHRVKGLEYEPERGSRCTSCFDMRFERSALYAYEHGFNVFTSSLGISRWKDMNQINGSGNRAAARYEGMIYWDYNWRKNGGSARMYEIAKREEFYQQEYCGCIYSLRDTNIWRETNGREKIQIGEKFYAAKLEEGNTQPISTTSIELDDKIRDRIKQLARSRHQSALAAWEEYRVTGLHITAEEADAWLAQLEAGEETAPPQCHI